MGIKLNATLTGMSGGFLTFWLLVWVFGIVLAKGVFSTLVSIFFPPWAVYLVVERFALFIGWL